MGLTFLFRFTGSSGQAIITRDEAFLVTDSRYWLQAENELDENWTLIRAPFIEGPKDWQGFLVVSCSNSSLESTLTSSVAPHRGR